MNGRIAVFLIFLGIIVFAFPDFLYELNEVREIKERLKKGIRRALAPRDYAGCAGLNPNKNIGVFSVLKVVSRYITVGGEGAYVRNKRPKKSSKKATTTCVSIENL